MRKVRDRLRCSECGVKACEVEDGNGREAGAYSPMIAVPRPSPEHVDLGRELRRARREARLTREELAKRIRHPPGEIAGVEAGYIPVRERYVSELLAACWLPEDRIGEHPGIAPPYEPETRERAATRGRGKARKPRPPRAVYH